MKDLRYSLATGTDPAWDRFVSENADPHPEQLISWGEAQRLAGWTPLRLQAWRGDTLVAGAQILERKIRIAGTVGYLNRGPLFAGDDAEVRHGFVAALKNTARERKHLYLAAVLPYSGRDTAETLSRENFMVRPDVLPPEGPMKATAILSLEPELDALLAEMRMSTRKHIRRGLKRGLVVRQGNASDIPTFERLFVLLCQRRGVRPNIPLGNFLVQVWRDFAARSQAKLFFACREGEPIAAFFLLAVGGWVRRWRAGWTGEHSDLYPNELLDWEIIRWAKAEGFKHYDFCGIDTRMAQCLAEGREPQGDEVCGISAFKLGFGGKVPPMNPEFCYFPNPLLRAAFNRGAAGLLQKGPLRRLLNRMASR